MLFVSGQLLVISCKNRGRKFIMRCASPKAWVVVFYLGCWCQKPRVGKGISRQPALPDGRASDTFLWNLLHLDRSTKLR